MVEYIEYYMQFDNEKVAMVENTIYYKMDELKVLYFLEIYHQRNDMVKTIEEYYRTFGADEGNLIFSEDEKIAIARQKAQKQK
jgi:hypothetical protein